MAGFYPDVPAPRLAWDRDGTVIYRTEGRNAIAYPNSTARAMNGEAEPATINSSVRGHVGMIFPQKIDLHGLFILLRSGGGAGFFVPNGWTLGSLETSEDTTTGNDGTWTERIPVLNADWLSREVVPYSRSAIRSLPVPGIQGIRFEITSDGYDRAHILWHLYGVRSESQRLSIWHPLADEPIGPAYFDWGDTPQGSSTDRQFRVINRKNGWIAKDVTVSAEALTDTTPSVVGQHLFSLDGENFGASVDLGDLEPSQPSPVITVRRNLALDAALGLWWARITASADSWIPEPE